MRETAPGPILEPMDGAPLIVTLELRVDGELISGRAIDDRGETVEFDGWLGLLAALDTLVLTASVPAPSTPTSDASSGRES